MDDAVSDDWLKIIEAERNALKELANGFKEVAQEQKNATVSLDNYNKSMDKSIRNYNAQAMVDGYKKDLQMLKNNLTEQIAEIDKAAEEELKIVSGNSKQKQEVEQKAAKAREAATKANQQAINNLNKEWGNKRLQIENQIAQNEIASQRQTLAIRLREIELERKKEIDAAKQYMNDDNLNYFVGGHSLGGVAASSYVSSNYSSISGLVLLGSYCTSNLSDKEFKTLSITATNDKVMNWENYEKYKSNYEGRDYADFDFTKLYANADAFK